MEITLFFYNNIFHNKSNIGKLLLLLDLRGYEKYGKLLHKVPYNRAKIKEKLLFRTYIQLVQFSSVQTYVQ